MQANQSLRQLLQRLWHHICIRRRRQFGLLLVLMLLASFAEILSIGAVLPFLGALSAPDRVFAWPIIQPVIHFLNLSDSSQILLPLTVTFCFAALIAGTIRVLLLWTSTRLSFATGSDLSLSIYRRTLYQPYAVHCARNSSEVIDAVSTKTNSVIYGAIVPILSLISSILMLVAILIMLIFVSPLIALGVFGIFGFIYAVIIYLTRKQLAIDSQRIANESTNVIKSLQEGLGGIRDVLLDGTQDVYCKIYRLADFNLRKAQSNNLFLNMSPRYAMEALGMILIAFLGYALSKKTAGIADAIPILGGLALGAQRLLPILQQAYGSWANIQSNRASLVDTLKMLDQPLPIYANKPTSNLIKFEKSINIKMLDFRYGAEAPYVLNQLNLTIEKGQRVGFIGATGSGKSTLLDIVMGLLQPTDGILEVDNQVISLENNRGWQAHIAHVPQVIFLADSSIEENIAFGVPKDQIDIKRVRQAAQQAQIAESIESWPNQYQTFVGERGVRLSGGQRQRIGIARALYKHADVIIFDEATSALDNETEQAVMQAIESLSKELTLLIIAHRLTTLNNCTQIVELGESGIKRVGSYESIMDQQSLVSQRSNYDERRVE